MLGNQTEGTSSQCTEHDQDRIRPAERRPPPAGRRPQPACGASGRAGRRGGGGQRPGDRRNGASSGQRPSGQPEEDGQWRCGPRGRGETSKRRGRARGGRRLGGRAAPRAGAHSSGTWGRRARGGGRVDRGGGGQGRSGEGRPAQPTNAHSRGAGAQQQQRGDGQRNEERTKAARPRFPWRTAPQHDGGRGGLPSLDPQRLVRRTLVPRSGVKIPLCVGPFCRWCTAT